MASWEKVRAAAPDFEGVYLDLANGYLTLSDPIHAIACCARPSGAGRRT